VCIAVESQGTALVSQQISATNICAGNTALLHNEQQLQVSTAFQSFELIIKQNIFKLSVHTIGSGH